MDKDQVEELQEKLKELSDRESAYVLNFLFGVYDTPTDSEFMKWLKIAIDDLSEIKRV